MRRVLRNRARYEVANNSYARGIVSTLANDTIGTGPRLQMLTPDAVTNRFVEREFICWSHAVRLAEKLRTMRVARAEDGEAFGILTNNERLDTPVTLDVKLVEADQVTTPEMTYEQSNVIDGIVFDDFGNPAEYHVLRYHPGDSRMAFDWSVERLPSRAVVHYFRCDRPGQCRGIPDISPALPLFAQLRRFTLAVLAAAETAADFAGILYTDAPANGEAESVEPMDTIELEKRALLTMPGGWKTSQFQAEQPATRELRQLQGGRVGGIPLMLQPLPGSTMPVTSGSQEFHGKSTSLVPWYGRPLPSYGGSHVSTMKRRLANKKLVDKDLGCLTGRVSGSFETTWTGSVNLPDGDRLRLLVATDRGQMPTEHLGLVRAIVRTVAETNRALKINAAEIMNQQWSLDAAYSTMSWQNLTRPHLHVFSTAGVIWLQYECCLPRKASIQLFLDETGSIVGCGGHVDVRCAS